MPSQSPSGWELGMANQLPHSMAIVVSAQIRWLGRIVLGSCAVDARRPRDLLRQIYARAGSACRWPLIRPHQLVHLPPGDLASRWSSVFGVARLTDVLRRSAAAMSSVPRFLAILLPSVAVFTATATPAFRRGGLLILRSLLARVEFAEGRGPVVPEMLHLVPQAQWTCRNPLFGISLSSGNDRWPCHGASEWRRSAVWGALDLRRWEQACHNAVTGCSEGHHGLVPMIVNVRGLGSRETEHVGDISRTILYICQRWRQVGCLLFSGDGDGWHRILPRWCNPRSPRPEKLAATGSANPSKPGASSNWMSSRNARCGISHAKASITTKQAAPDILAAPLGCRGRVRRHRRTFKY